MEYNSSIINAGGGIICCYGYIKERLDTNLYNENEPSIENNDGSIFYTPITIYDFFGGTFTTSALYPIFSQEQGRTPFHIFDFPNIQAEITFFAGSKMYCYYDIYMNDTHFNGTFYIIGEKDSDCLFGLDSGSVSFYYSGKKDKRSSDDKYEYSYSFLDFDTNPDNSNTDEVILSQTYVSINSETNLYIKHFTFNIEIYGYSAIIDTARFFIPFSYKFIINVKNGASLYIQYDTKFLAGSSLIIDEGAYAEFDANVIFYSENSKIYNSMLSSYYPDNLPAAICLINGAAIFKDSFGGILTTSVNNALVQTSGDYSNSVSVSEAITSNDYDTISLSGSASLTHDLENENISSQNLQEGYTYISKGNYFYATKSNDPVSLVIHDQNGEKETLIVDQTYPSGATLNLSVFYDTDLTSSIENVHWEKDSNEYVSIDDGILTIGSNAYPSSWGITTITITATVIYSEENNNYTLSGTYALSLYNFTSCFEKGTLISTKRGCIPIESLTIKDEILSFNHFTGKFEYRPISLIVNHGIGIYEIMKLLFSDGSEINLIGNHGLFDKTLNKYVDICVDNCSSFKNHDFVRYIDGEIKLVKLVNVNIERRMTESYTCFSYGNLNSLANNFLNITSIVYGFYNLFNYLENMQYDAKEMEENIAKYGLTSYEDLKDDVSKDIFEAFNGKFINIAIGKGLLTQDSLMDLINNWLNKLVKNKEAFTNYDIY